MNVFTQVDDARLKTPKRRFQSPKKVTCFAECDCSSKGGYSMALAEDSPQETKNRPEKSRRQWWQDKLNWLGEHYAKLLLIYFAISVLYQGISVLPENLWWGSLSRYQEVDGYCLGIRYPKTIPLVPPGKPGRPLTVWMWQTDQTVSCDASGAALVPTSSTPPVSPVTPTLFSSTTITSTFRVLLGVPGDVILTDEAGHEMSPALEIRPAQWPSEALRETLYVRSKPDSWLGRRVEVGFQVLEEGGTVAGVSDISPLVAHTEGNARSAVRRVCDLLLNTPTLSIASVLAALLSLWQKRREERQKKEKALEEQIEHLLEIPPQQVWLDYWRLWEEIETVSSSDLKSRLQWVWRSIQTQHSTRPWSYAMRRWLTQQLNTRDTEAARDLLDRLVRASALTKEKQETLLDFLATAQEEEKPDIAELLDQTLHAFQILGLASTGMVLLPLREREHALDAETEFKKTLGKTWYVKGGAAGRFLLRTWAEKNETVKGWLDEWQRDDPTPANRVQGPCNLWPREFPALPASHRDVLGPFDSEEQQALCDWFTPFGPLRAEQDPRLPARSGKDEDFRPHGLFWAEHPLWDEVKARRPGIFVAPRESGRSSLIWMARRQSHLGGRSPALSLYLLLDHPIAPEKLREKLREACVDALGESLACALVEDPFWLLNAGSMAQRSVASILLRWAGEVEELAVRLDRRGLFSETPDGGLLLELLCQFSVTGTVSWAEIEHAASQARRALGQTWGPGGIGTFPAFVWVDVRFTGETLQNMITSLWNEGELFKIGCPKLFIPEQVCEDDIPLKWQYEDLKALLDYRCDQVNFTDIHWSKVKKSVGLANPEDWLIEKADGRPARLIYWGNRLLEGSLERKDMQ
jgi:hypothetical protein